MTLPQGRIIGTHRGQATGGYGIADVDRPQPRQPLDLDAIAEFNAGTRRAADEYALHPLSDCGHRGRCKKEHK